MKDSKKCKVKRWFDKNTVTRRLTKKKRQTLVTPKVGAENVKKFVTFSCGGRMNFNPKPKPVRESAKRKPVKRITSVCVDCGAWWRGGASEEWHEPDCEHELPVITKRERKTERQMVNEALDELCRRITTWRDGVKCHHSHRWMRTSKPVGACHSKKRLRIPCVQPVKLIPSK